MNNEPVSADVGLRLIRGGTIRIAGYAIGTLLTGAGSVLLLRHLGVSGFGRLMTVASLIAIVGGVTDAGLTTVGGRDLALLRPGDERRRMLRSLLGLRLVVTPLCIIGAIAFALVARYDRILVGGVALGGLGLLLTAAQATAALPLAVEFRIGSLALVDLVRQLVMVAGIALLVLLGSSLLPFFGIPVAVAAAALVTTAVLVRHSLVLRPSFDRAALLELVRETLPIGASLVMNIIYFRVLIVLMSIEAAPVATGLFATSFRVFELFFGISSLIVSAAIPALAIAAQDRARLRYMLQRMLEVSSIASSYFAVIVFIVARPALELLGGNEFGAAAPVLRIQIFALIPVFLGQACQAILVATRRQGAQAFANAIGLGLVLALGLALVPSIGAKGAAIAALAAETGLLAVVLVLLARGDPLLRAGFGFAWKPATATGGALLVLLLPSPSPVATAACATAIYVAALVVTRAVPREIVDAFKMNALP